MSCVHGSTMRLPVNEKKTKPIPAFPGYHITEDGEVFSSKYSIHVKGMAGTITRFDGPLHPIKPFLDGRYWQIKLRNKGKRSTILVHKLVLETFCGPRPKGMVARHLDGNKNNNNISNLAWGTNRQNQLDRFDHGTASIGSKNVTAKLKEADVSFIRTLKQKPWSRESAILQRELSERFSVTKRTVRDIWTGTSWGWMQ